MPNTAHVIINGTKYDLPENTAKEGPSGPAIQNLEGKLKDFAHGSSSPLTIQVIIDKHPVNLTIQNGQLTTYAAWVVESAAFVPQRIR